jgi:hypothetical protein
MPAAAARLIEILPREPTAVVQADSAADGAQKESRHKPDSFSRPPPSSTNGTGTQEAEYVFHGLTSSLAGYHELPKGAEGFCQVRKLVIGI